MGTKARKTKPKARERHPEYGELIRTHVTPEGISAQFYADDDKGITIVTDDHGEITIKHLTPQDFLRQLAAIQQELNEE